uniref:Uncharacterized protein n=1 Tax=Aureoumbra lagunensis TaxID=44058 RepID=A0A7S3K5W1_9STRA|mmetsp:Transcript_17989/g.27082  ORF Transcript_17989/g.27082 Transcript_17989/m.27082 type:complete len:389 (+) Transcript_17989:143-1309(+)
MRLSAIGAMIPSAGAEELKNYYIQSGISKVEQSLVIVLQIVTAIISIGWLIAAKKWISLSCQAETCVGSSRKASLSVGAKLINENLDWTKNELIWMFSSCSAVCFLESFQLRKALIHSTERVALLTRSSLRMAVAFGVTVRCYCVLASFWQVEARLKLIESDLSEYFPLARFSSREECDSLKYKFSIRPKNEFIIIFIFFLFRTILYVPGFRKWAEKLNEAAKNIDSDTCNGYFVKLQLPPSSAFDNNALQAIKNAMDSDIWCNLLNILAGITAAAFVWRNSIIHKTTFTHCLITSGLVVAWILFGCARKIAKIGTLQRQYYNKIKSTSSYSPKSDLSLSNAATNAIITLFCSLDDLIGLIISKYAKLPLIQKSAVSIALGSILLAFF